MMFDNVCVVCGEYIPEGYGLLCYGCAHESKTDTSTSLKFDINTIYHTPQNIQQNNLTTN